MEYRKQSHAVYHCKYHLILPTKYRRAIFNKGMTEYLKLKILEIKKYYPEIDFERISSDKDHLHILASIPPKMSIGSVVRLIKTNTSRGIKQKFPFLKNVYWGTDGIWSEGYFISTTGINEEIIRKYIEAQQKEDVGQSEGLR
jgi:putative transposase